MASSAGTEDHCSSQQPNISKQKQHNQENIHYWITAEIIFSLNFKGWEQKTGFVLQQILMITRKRYERNNCTHGRCRLLDFKCHAVMILSVIKKFIKGCIFVSCSIKTNVSSSWSIRWDIVYINVWGWQIQKTDFYFEITVFLFSYLHLK